ncbi:MAG: putative Na+/H+ antiporter [SAR324 cluster bacterium]|nr:putative Na+/H+ antiporter [SAR324 cluster bacterium]
MLLLAGIIVLSSVLYASGTAQDAAGSVFPKPLESYHDPDTGVMDILASRISAEPFNLVGSLIFLCAILHTFVASKITAYAHHLAHEHKQRLKKQGMSNEAAQKNVHFGAEILHFFGEVEAIFGIWVIMLGFAITAFYDWSTVVHYIGRTVNYTEPMFVVVIMTLASTRPIMKFAESSLLKLAQIGGSKVSAWWITILIVAPIMGSFITEPGAMTIGALLLAKQFYSHKPSPKLAYATIGLLFVNVSVGGTLTHFAAPPVLMVAGPWGWDMAFMFEHFGWKAVVGVVISTMVYYYFFIKEFKDLEAAAVKARQNTKKAHHDDADVPAWVIAVHILFMVWTVVNNHYPALFIGGFLFFLGFAKATMPHQNQVDLKPALLVGFFLAGLVTHGGVQAWWIAPVLGSLSEVPLMLGATFLTAFNDNAAITYLSTLVPNFSDAMKYAVVAGAVTGGGLTVIANAPNPAGQAILGKFFENGVSPAKLAIAAMFPTIVVGLCFMLIR